ncbi:MAG: carboxypeptidase regulatory-like domain-containing protein [Gammaproteobacteria bacterium]|nr:carboxypeptidase regulatory-like domain-containing protein [Gammaproteobacteria bacterium]MCF6337201.1 carboxypeptidase regulatory-like domain-containing protein [Gammaproteobacteria bacterium]
MNPKIIRDLALAALIITLSACSGGGSDGKNPSDPGTTFTVTPAVVEQIQILTADNNPLEGATITVSGNTSPATDIDGIFSVIGGLDIGEHVLELVGSDGTTVSITVSVTSENGAKIITILAPLSSDDEGVTFTDVSAAAVIASVSGTVHSSSEIIQGASVSISGGAATNGIFSTAVTDANGRYNLLINVNASLADALQTSTIIASADGYQSRSINYSVVNGTTNTGINLQLTTGSNTGNALFHETFEPDSPTVDQWTTTKVIGDNIDNMWHIHTAGENIINEAYSDGFVRLAPNDTSAGAVPDPVEGIQAYWYGSKVVDSAGSVQGNFIDTHDVVADSADSGGTSSEMNNSGWLTSPVIDLSGATGDLSLTFRTFWEIESVNPNSGGFDLMTIETSNNGGTTWAPIARLNPLSDPASLQNRDPIPFSNTGYNSAPIWSQQELIQLLDVAGSSEAMIRFSFDTVDELYNGFRGWMIDDIKIINQPGTFPVLDIFSAKSGTLLESQKSTPRRSR